LPTPSLTPSNPRRRRILIGLVVLSVSQFGPWQHMSGGTVAMLGLQYESSLSTVGGVPYYTAPGHAVSGWALHPLALLVLPALLAIYWLGLRPGAFWPRYGVAITLALMVVSGLVSINVSDWGALIGWIGIGIAGSALRLKAA
jgi:hypothetical protein